jgi:hypothetical protein
MDNFDLKKYLAENKLNENTINDPSDLIQRKLKRLAGYYPADIKNTLDDLGAEEFKKQLDDLKFYVDQYFELKEGQSGEMNEEARLHRIGDDAENLIVDLEKKGIITKGIVSGTGPNKYNAGKLQIEIYPTVDTSKNLDKLFPEMDKHYENLGRSQTGKMTYKFANNLYGFLWNEEGNSVTIVLMRKNPVK